MRLVKVSAPNGKGANVAQTAFSVGIEQVSIQTAETHRVAGEPQMKDLVDIKLLRRRQNILLTRCSKPIFTIQKITQLIFVSRVRLSRRKIFGN